MSFIKTPLRQISGMFAQRKIAAMEILDEYLKAALSGSCITFCKELSFDRAKNLDISTQTALPAIAALPFSVKDNYCVDGVLTTCNSKALKTYVPNFTNGIVKNLMGSNAILTAKNCMREFSVGKFNDCAFEIISHMVWCGTNINVNIGAFSMGTDLGLSDTYCGTWVLKLTGLTANGIISGAPSLEAPTLNARCADDLSFLYPHFYNGKTIDEIIDANNCKIFVCNDLGRGGHLVDLFENLGFNTGSSDLSVLNDCGLLYDVILCTEFYTHLMEIGKPDKETYRWYNHEYIRNRTEGFGFDVKTNIIKGAHLLMENNLQRTATILDLKPTVEKVLYSLLDTYDYLAAPVIYDDKLSKASAIAGLAELTVPFGDVMHFKLFTMPTKQRKLVALAKYLEDKI